MKKIMIVDDAMFMRKVIRNNLEKGGYTQILEAENGEQALELFKEEKPALVLLDITMPGKSGIQVLTEIIAMEPEAKVIMCSAVGQEMMITQAIEAGASDFIVKPFDGDEFMKVVNNWMPERA